LEAFLELDAIPTNGTPTAPRGRFKVRNQAARRHGLRAGTRTELRRVDRRTSRLLSKYLTFRADSGRPIMPAQVPLARDFVRLEIRSTDLYAALSRDPLNSRLNESFLATVRTKGNLAVLLGEVDRHAKPPTAEALQAELWWRSQLALKEINQHK
jgi:hypothetical protein